MHAVHDPAVRAAQLQPAGVVTRVLADAVDFGLVALVYVVSIVLMGVVDALLSDARWSLPDVAAWIHAVGFPLVFAAYLAWCWSSTGSSIGKRIFGLRLRSLDGGPVGVARSVLRALLCALVIGPIGLLWCVVSRRRAAVHDLLLRTAVLYDWRSRTPA